MATVIATLGTLTGGAATLLMLVLLLASTPNGKPEDLSRINWLMLAVALVGGAGMIGAALSMFAGRNWMALGIGLTPAIFVVGLFAWLLTTGQ